MKLSKNKLNEYIDLYLSDSYDYEDSDTHTLNENVLKPVKNLLLESKKDGMTILLEISNRVNKRDKAVIDDFILYLENI